MVLVFYMKEGSRSLIGVEFGRYFVIMLQHRMRLDCELVDVFFLSGKLLLCVA